MNFLLRVTRELGLFLDDLFWFPLRGNRSRLAVQLRALRYRTSCYLDTDVTVTVPRNFRSGPRSALYHGSYILNTHGSFTLGSHSHLGAYCYVNAHYGTVSIGDDVAIGPGTKLIAYSNHYAPGTKVTDERMYGDIVIGNNVFIGANCVILPGATIGNHVIVGANSLIKGVLDKNSVYVGSPCRKIRSGWYE
jgi:galactoside O-acetyltransferase